MNLFIFSLLISCLAFLSPSLATRDSGVNARMWGGKLTEWDDYPFFAGIRYSKTQKYPQRCCGGSFIMKKWIVTAAHCIADVEPDGIHVLTELDPKNGTPPEKVSLVKRRFTHPILWPSREPEHPDIGLIELESDPSDKVKLIRLVSPGQDASYINSEKNATIIASGSSVWSDRLDPPYRLKEAETRLTLNRLYSEEDSWIIMPHRVGSFEFPPHRYYVCPGDSGSPIFCSDSSGQLLIGVMASSTYRCDQPLTSYWAEILMNVRAIRVQPSAAWILHTIDAYSNDSQLESMKNLYMSLPPILSGDSPWN